MGKAYGVCCHPYCLKRIDYLTQAYSHPIYCSEHEKMVKAKYSKEFPSATDDDLFWLTHRENIKSTKQTRQLKLE